MSVLIKPGVYVIHSVAHPGNVLDLHGFRFANGTPINSDDENGGQNQKWFVTPILADGGAHTGKYVFVSASSGNYLSSVQTNPSALPPLRSLQSNTAADYWNVLPGVQQGAYYIQSVSDEHRVIDLANSNGDSGSPVILQTVNQPLTTNQQWLFKKAD